LRNIRCLLIFCLVLPLSACLKVTGEAKDQFDLEEEEYSPKIVRTLNQRDSTTEESKQSLGIAEAVTGETPILVEPSTNNSSSIESSEIDPQDFADFLKWKRQRDIDSAEYQEFLEFQEFLEYKQWREYKDANIR